MRRRRKHWRAELTSVQREHLREAHIGSVAGLRDMMEKMSTKKYTAYNGLWMCDVCCDIAWTLRRVRPDLKMSNPRVHDYGVE